MSPSGSGKEVSVSSGLDAVSHRVAVVIHQSFGVYKVYNNLSNEKIKKINDKKTGRKRGAGGEQTETYMFLTCAYMYRRIHAGQMNKRINL